MAHTKRVMPELSSGAMADIAFLMLTFYMVTTEIKEYKGLSMMLPQYLPEVHPPEKHSRNLFTIRINSVDEIMIESKEVSSFNGVRKQIKEFVMNNKRNPNLSDSPKDAVVSIKTDRGTTYKTFIMALDEAQAAYYEIYAERAGVSPERFRKLKTEIPAERKIHDKAKEGIPMNISIAESN